MRIGIDIRALSGGRRTGVEEYVLNTLQSLFKHDRRNHYVLFYNAWNNPHIDLEWISDYPNVSVKVFRVPNKLLNLSLWYFRYPKLDRLIGGVDVFFSPNVSFCALSRRVRHVLTIHDLSFEHFPETFSLKRRLWHVFINPRRMCRQADKIIAVSDFTKIDLLETYRMGTSKVTVVPNGVSESYGPIDRNSEQLVSVQKKYNLPYRFVLFLGTLEPRKNIRSIVRSFVRMKRVYPDLKEYKLVIAGSRGWRDKHVFSGLNPRDILFLGEVPEEDKCALYNLATLFVYPSLFEGFGLPPLEAMKCGTPVLTSHSSALPSVVGTAAIMVDPERPNEIMRAMADVLRSRDLQTELSYRGLQRSKDFLWKKTVERLLEVFEEIH